MKILHGHIHIHMHIHIHIHTHIHTHTKTHKIKLCKRRGKKFKRILMKSNKSHIEKLTNLIDLVARSKN